MVNILLQKGASVTSRTKNGLTALHMAAQGDHVECASVLLFYKAPIDAVTKVSKLLFLCVITLCVFD